MTETGRPIVPGLHPETQRPPDPGDATIELLRKIGVPADEISRFAGVVSGKAGVGP